MRYKSEILIKLLDSTIDTMMYNFYLHNNNNGIILLVNHETFYFEELMKMNPIAFVTNRLII